MGGANFLRLFIFFSCSVKDFKDQLKKLSETDPEFYQYLQENDQKLLEFKSDTEEEEESEEEEEEEKLEFEEEEEEGSENESNEEHDQEVSKCTCICIHVHLVMDKVREGCGYFCDCVSNYSLSCVCPRSDSCPRPLALVMLHGR